jgi:hypothetical protein
VIGVTILIALYLVFVFFAALLYFPVFVWDWIKQKPYENNAR